MEHAEASAQPAGVAGDSAVQSFTLESLNGAVNYHAWVCDLVRPYLGDDPLEIGSGLGDYAARWLADGVPRITVSEADASRLVRLSERFAIDDRVTVRALDLCDAGPGTYSALVAVNVLEHIEDDVAALRAAAGLVRTGGAVIMFVPAFPIGMSAFDHTVGHFRRYRRGTLSAAYAAAGLRLERLHHVNAPGLPAWIVGMRLLRMTPQDGPTVRAWDRYVIPLARAAESRVAPPFGQSLFAVGRVTP
jgi:cyclopropane fatty-acyl-phospholipid synthase-like methyltransferase